MAVNKPTVERLRQAFGEPDFDPIDPALEKRLDDAFAFLEQERLLRRSNPATVDSAHKAIEGLSANEDVSLMMEGDSPASPVRRVRRFVDRILALTK